MLLTPVFAQSQVRSKLWYDGNARVVFNRDALEGTLKETDTVSTRSNGGGSTMLDLGFHFTPIDDIEIFSEIRLKNDFGGMWGNRNYVELRNLSAKGVINNNIAFSVGDIDLKQTKFTRYLPNHAELLDEDLNIRRWWSCKSMMGFCLALITSVLITAKLSVFA